MKHDRTPGFGLEYEVFPQPGGVAQVLALKALRRRLRKAQERGLADLDLLDPSSGNRRGKVFGQDLEERKLGHGGAARGATPGGGGGGGCLMKGGGAGGGGGGRDRPRAAAP